VTNASASGTLLLIGLEVILLRSEKNDTLTVSMEIYKGAIFDRLKINVAFVEVISGFHPEHKYTKILSFL
jgi:hypothetical protein